MPRYKLTIEYDGRPYKGFQAQDDLPSGQGSIERAGRGRRVREVINVEGFSGSRYQTEHYAQIDEDIHAA